MLKMNMPEMICKVINRSSNPLPHYASSSAAGMDLRANLSAPLVLNSLERALVPTGLYIELPEGFEAQIRSRMQMQHPEQYRMQADFIINNTTDDKQLIEQLNNTSCLKQF